MPRRAWVISCLAACSTATPPPPGAPAARAESPAPPAREASLVLLGGRVRTFDAARPEATAIAFADGKIVAVGDDEGLRRWIGPRTKVVGIRGKTALPGLADAHFHVFGVGEKGRIVDLVGTKSIKDIQDKLANAARAGGGWLIGRGWDQNDWGAGGAFPSAKDLDAAVGERPAILTRIDGHALWASSAAMRAAGVGKDTKDPPGGRVLRGAGGLPTGIFVDNAMALVESAAPPPSMSDLRRAFLLGEREALKAGLTQIQDMGLSRPELAILRELEQAGDLKIRVYAMLDGGVEDLDDMLGSGPTLPRDDPKSRLTIRGVKLYLDGALGSRGAALLQPYDDDPKSSGLILMDPELYEARVRTAKERGYQVATHAIGDRANRLALDVYERVFGKASKERPRIEHAQVVSLDDLSRFAELGVIPSMQPTHATSDLPWAQERVGVERLKGAYAWRSLQTRGATLAFGSDAPVEDASVVGGLYAAIFRQSADEFLAEPWSPEERLSPAAAVRAFSAGAAYASFREAEAGRIAPGMAGDVTVLDVDPFAADAAKLGGAHPELTIVAGELVYARPGADRAPEEQPIEPARTSSAAR